MNIQERLFSMQDLEYKAFQGRIIPGIAPETIIGVRTPALRNMARELIKTGEAERLTAELPHEYFEENQLHAFIISANKNYDSVLVMSKGNKTSQKVYK